MPFARDIQTAILNLILRGEEMGGFAINDTTDPVEDFYVSLHTADPTDLGTQATNEIAYTGYARPLVERTPGGVHRFDVAAGVASPSSAIDFGQCSAGGGTVTHIGIGRSASGPGNPILFGELEVPIVIEAGDIPRLTTESTFILR